MRKKYMNQKQLFFVLYQMMLTLAFCFFLKIVGAKTVPRIRHSSPRSASHPSLVTKISETSKFSARAARGWTSFWLSRNLFSHWCSLKKGVDSPIIGFNWSILFAIENTFESDEDLILPLIRVHQGCGTTPTLWYHNGTTRALKIVSFWVKWSDFWCFKNINKIIRLNQVKSTVKRWLDLKKAWNFIFFSSNLLNLSPES